MGDSTGSKRAPLKTLMALCAVFVVILALAALVVLQRPGASTAEEAARRYLMAAASGKRLAAYRVGAGGIQESPDGGFVLNPQDAHLAQTRQDFFGRDATFHVRDLELKSIPMPENNEGGSEGFAVGSYVDSSGSRSTAPSVTAEGPAILQIQRQGDSWFVSGY